MNAEIEQVLTQFIETLQVEIQAGLPRSVSGKTRAGVESNVTSSADGISGTLTAPKYIFTFEYGRPPTRQGATKGSPTLQQAIEQWVEAKNFRWSREIKRGGSTFIKVLTAKQMSWAIAIKIHKEGNKLFRDLKGGKTGVITGVVTDARIKAFTDAFSEKTSRLILNDVYKDIRIKA